MKKFLLGFLNILNEILFFFFPFIKMMFDNLKIKKKIDKDNDILEDIAILKKISEKDIIAILEKKYNDTIDTKNRFEDKAKTNIVAVTISVTLIMGAFNVLNAIKTKYNLIWVNWLSSVIFIFAVLFMIIAAILSIRVLIAKNQIYSISLKSYIDKEILKEDYLDSTACNIKQNYIRNNMIFASYGCIRNAFLCLMAVLIILANPIC